MLGLKPYGYKSQLKFTPSTIPNTSMITITEKTTNDW